MNTRIAVRWVTLLAVAGGIACTETAPATDPPLAPAQTSSDATGGVAPAATSGAAATSGGGSGPSSGVSGAGGVAASGGAGAGVAGMRAIAAGDGGAPSQPAAAGSTTAAAGAPAVAAGSGASGAAAAPAATEKFSFFVTSLSGMRTLSKNEQGFGGDLRYGESTGLAGADKICTELAESSMPGAGAKGWRAFLSTAKGGANDGPIHAKDRIGSGPWYDRRGRVVAMNLQALLQPRPSGADPAIINDLPNERGEPNHTDTVAGMDDNHDVVTGSSAQGMWDGTMTCQDWTSHDTPMPMPMGQAGAPGGPGRGFPGGGAIPTNGPRVGHSWPAQQSGTSWITAHVAHGCSPSVALVQNGPGMAGTGIGNAGGYGAIYCFALAP